MVSRMRLNFTSGANVSYPVSARSALATSLRAGHCSRVRIVSLIMLSIFAFQARATDPVFGIWRLNAARSTFAGDTQPRSLTVRIEPHVKGEVFTLDRTETNGRSTSSSVLLYFDGRGRTSVLDRRRNAQSGRSVALTVPVPVSGIQSRNNFNRTKKGCSFWRSRT